MGWIAHWLGLDNGGGPIYLFLSGAGANLGEVTIIGGMAAAWRHHTCHVDSPRFCWRLGTHPVAGTPYRTCKRHHPTVPERVSAEHIRKAAS